MATIVNLADGPEGQPPINLDHVARFEPVARDPDTLVCYDARGQKLGLVRALDIPMHPSAIVEERRGTDVVHFSGDGESWTEPVLAWQIIDGQPKPITPLGTLLEVDDHWCLEVTVASVATWIFPDGQRCTTLDEARRYATRVAEPRRDHALRAVAGGAR
ncbi:MAG: hypothetical protein IT177_07695 [Acidobacteria bacterium]|nr:hypothetical protein [Acidobacteriota bacterium]